MTDIGEIAPAAGEPGAAAPGATARARCPRCGAGLVGGGSYVEWCEGCDWNVSPIPEQAAPTGLLDRRRGRAAARAADHIYAALEGREVTRPGWDARRVASYAIALALHATTLAVAALGAWLVAVGWPNLWTVGCGLLVLGIAVGLRPRFGRVPTDAARLTRAQAPQLWALLDDVAAAAGADRVEVLLVNRDFNASSETIGLRRTRVVTIGLALWAALAPQERVAVLGHELGHSRNGDSRHGLVVGTAMDTLSVWWDGLAPQPVRVSGHLETRGLVALSALLSAMVSWVGRVVVSLLKNVLETLDLRAGQRAEYLADQMGARVGGSDGMASGLQALLLADGVSGALRRSAMAGDGDMWAAVSAYRQELPAVEWERRGRAARLQRVVEDETHPPTMFRVDLVRARTPQPAAVVMDIGRTFAVDRELEAVGARLGRRARDDARSGG